MGQLSERCLLDGIPDFGPYCGGPRPPEDDPFPALLTALLEFDHQTLGFEDPDAHCAWHDLYIYLLGASGLAFRSWWSVAGWSFEGSAYPQSLPDPAASVRLAFEAAGYGFEWVTRPAYAGALGLPVQPFPSREALRERIVVSIRDRGRPVFVVNLADPPEFGLVTGFDEGGDVLLGRTFFQQLAIAQGTPVEPEGTLRLANAYETAQAFVFLGDPQTPRRREEVYREALRHGLEILRLPTVRGQRTGPAAVTAWADELLNDAAFADLPADTLQDRFALHHTVAGMMAEWRAWGQCFLTQAAKALPDMASDLVPAISAFGKIHDLVWAIWEFTGGWQPGEEAARRFSEPGTRARIVPLLRMIREQDEVAADAIEAALKRETPPGVEALVLPDVPRVGYDVHPCPLPGCVAAILKFLNRPYDYHELMAVSGAAFRMVWKKDDPSNIDLMHFQPDTFERLFEALGYEYQVVPQDREAILAALRRSLRRGRPAIAFGLVGPPEACLVTGIEEGGEVLVGWSYFQSQETSGYFRKSDWFEAMQAGPPMGLLLMGDKNRWFEFAPKRSLRRTIRYAIVLARTAQRASKPDHVFGLAAYDAMARALEVDEDYPSSPSSATKNRSLVLMDQACMVDERKHAATYLSGQSGIAGRAGPHLDAAARLYRHVADLSPRVYPFGMSTDPEVIEAGLGRAEVRYGIAQAMREAGELEAEAVTELEYGLRILDDEEE